MLPVLHPALLLLTIQSSQKAYTSRLSGASLVRSLHRIFGPLLDRNPDGIGGFSIQRQDEIHLSFSNQTTV